MKDKIRVSGKVMIYDITMEFHKEDLLTRFNSFKLRHNPNISIRDFIRMLMIGSCFDMIKVI